MGGVGGRWEVFFRLDSASSSPVLRGTRIFLPDLPIRVPNGDTRQINFV